MKRISIIVAALVLVGLVATEVPAMFGRHRQPADNLPSVMVTPIHPLVVNKVGSDGFDIQKIGDHCQVEVLLLSYQGDDMERGVLEVAGKKYGVKHMICHPDDYLPIIIPAKDYSKVQALLGAAKVKRLQPGLD